MRPCDVDPCDHEVVKACGNTPAPMVVKSGWAGRIFSCFSQPDVCDDQKMHRMQPPEECPVECMTPQMRRAVWLHTFEMIATVLLIVVGALAATGNLGEGKDPFDPTEGYYIGLRPQDWVWALNIAFWIMLLAGTAVAIRTAYRSAAVEYVLMPCYTVIVGILLWVAAIFVWLFESTHIGAFVLVLSAALLFHYAMHQLYATGSQVPTTVVYIFWIGAVAFAAGWSIYVATFLLDTVLTAQEISGFLPGETSGSTILAAVLLAGFTTIWAFSYYSFIYAGIVAIGVGASLGGNLDRGKGVGDILSITLIVALVLLGKIWLLSFYKRFISKASNDGGAIFVGKRHSVQTKYV